MVRNVETLMILHTKLIHKLANVSLVLVYNKIGYLYYEGRRMPGTNEAEK